MTIGDGPVYAVLGMPQPPPHRDGVVNLSDDVRQNGWYWHKTLWAVSERYGGPVLIRGARIDRPGPLRFGLDDGVVTALTMPPEQKARWRYGVSSTLVRGAGCFAFQVDGTNFSDMLVFVTTLQS